MMLDATCKAAETSVQSWSMVLSHSSTEGIWDVVEMGGRNSGWKPYQTWKGERPVALWE